MSEIGVIICYTKCWPCNFGQHPGGQHTWADSEDIEHARNTGQPDPSQQTCGCPCVKDPSWVTEDEPLPPDLDGEIDAPACPVCDEPGACGYDSEGRPMVHLVFDEDESA